MNRQDYYHESNMPRANSIVPAASAVVADKDDRILLHKRKDNKSWSLLGGAMEPGESLTETIIREVQEEAGLIVRVDKLVGVYSDPGHIIEYSDGEIRQQFSICFACSILSGKLSLSEESYELKFFSREEMEKINIHPAQMLRINDYFEMSERAIIR